MAATATTMLPLRQEVQVALLEVITMRPVRVQPLAAAACTPAMVENREEGIPTTKIVRAAAIISKT